jgi:xanthine/uracil permease
LESLANIDTTLASIVEAIGSTGMAVAAIIGLILDNLLPGTPEDRGITS